MDKAKNLKPWKKGQSGNPKGRAKIPEEVRELARCYTQEAIEAQVSVMRDTEAPPAARVSAAENILNRAWGKPESNLTINAGSEFAAVLTAAAAIVTAGRAGDADSAVAAEPAAVH